MSAEAYLPPPDESTSYPIFLIESSNLYISASALRRLAQLGINSVAVPENGQQSEVPAPSQNGTHNGNGSKPLAIP